MPGGKERFLLAPGPLLLVEAGAALVACCRAFLAAWAPSLLGTDTVKGLWLPDWAVAAGWAPPLCALNGSSLPGSLRPG